mgnify:CR=1 FL=1
MSKKKAFALRINEDTMKAIEKWAADEFRSTNGQIEWMLMQYLKEHKREPKTSKKNYHSSGQQKFRSFCIFHSLDYLFDMSKSVCRVENSSF